MSTPIFDLTHSCLELFDRLVANHDSTLLTHLIPLCDDGNHRKAPPCDFMGIRNSFLFWINDTGALSLLEHSLDAQLEGLTNISTVVLELLEVTLRSLKRLETVPHGEASGALPGATVKLQYAQKDISKWESACETIQVSLDELSFVASRIQKASAKRLDQMVGTAITPEDAMFRENIVSLIRDRFPAARQTLCQQLGDSIADRRQMILQTKRHAKTLAIQRGPLPSGAIASPQVRPSDAGSVPHPPKALSAAKNTISTSLEHSFEYPKLPKSKEGETGIQCPFCFVPLDRGGIKEKCEDEWKRHVDEHLQPYPCLFPKCANAFTFFLRRRDWKAHMENSHSRDWMRKVHTFSWYCDIDHEKPLIFETESLWRKHMEDLTSHPKRNLEPPSQAQLNALSYMKQGVVERDLLVCPLCEQVPHELQAVAREGRGDSAELETQVVDHVADHLKSLSMLALPSLQDLGSNLGS